MSMKGFMFCTKSFSGPYQTALRVTEDYLKNLISDQ